MLAVRGSASMECHCRYWFPPKLTMLDVRRMILWLLRDTGHATRRVSCLCNRFGTYRWIVLPLCKFVSVYKATALAAGRHNNPMNRQILGMAPYLQGCAAEVGFARSSSADNRALCCLIVCLKLLSHPPPSSHSPILLCTLNA
jgi:hypothetical protein